MSRRHGTTRWALRWSPDSHRHQRQTSQCQLPSRLFLVFLFHQPRCLPWLTMALPALGRWVMPLIMGTGERRCLVPPPRRSPYCLPLVSLIACSNTWPVRNACWQQEYMPHPPLIPGNSHAVELKCGSFKNWTQQRVTRVSTVQVHFWDFRVIFIMCIYTYMNIQLLFYDFIK